MLGAGLFGDLPAEAVSHATRVTAPERGVAKEYGEYLVNISGCSDCHGPQLNGGKSPDPAQTWISPNLTPGGELASWTEEQFITALRMGITPSGRQLSAAMPQEYRNFYDDELQAIWLYLQSLPKLPQYTE